MIKVFNEKDKIKLINKGMRFICEQQIDNQKVYIFDFNKNMNFDLSDVKYIESSKLFF